MDPDPEAPTRAWGWGGEGGEEGVAHGQPPPDDAQRQSCQIRPTSAERTLQPRGKLHAQPGARRVRLPCRLTKTDHDKDKRHRGQIVGRGGSFP